MAGQFDNRQPGDGADLPADLEAFRARLVRSGGNSDGPIPTHGPANDDALDLSKEIFGELFGQEARQRLSEHSLKISLDPTVILQIILRDMGEENLRRKQSEIARDPDARNALRETVLTELEHRLSKNDRELIERLFGLGNGQPLTGEQIALEDGRTVASVEDQKADALRALMGYGSKGKTAPAE